jgi:hypothetical protein
MWEESTGKDFLRCLKWRHPPPVVVVQLERIGQATGDLEVFWPEADPMSGLSGYIVDVTGMITGV